MPSRLGRHATFAARVTCPCRGRSREPATRVGLQTGEDAAGRSPVLIRRAGHGGIRPGSAARPGNAAPAVEIGGGLPHPIRIVVEHSKPGVAIVAKQPAHRLRLIAMIDEKPALGIPLADGADAVLLRQHALVVLGGEAVFPQAIACTPPLAEFGNPAPFF